MNLRISDFCHFVKGADGLTALYNALTLGVVIVDQNTAEFFKKAKNKVIPSEQACLLDSQLLQELAKNKLVFDLGQRPDLEDYLNIQKMLSDKKIGILYLLMTDVCNLACTYCFIEGVMPENYRYSKMSPETARFGIDLFARALESNKEIESPQIIFYGGEPLGNFPVVEYAIRYIEDFKNNGKLPQGTFITINTNGTLINERIVEVLKEFEDINVALSIDGPEEIHNRHRKYRGGTGTFNDVMRGYRLLTKNGLSTGACCTITKDNVDQLQDISRWLVNELGATSVSFNILIEAGKAGTTRGDARSYAKKAAEQIIQCYRFFREKGVYEDRIMRKVNAFVDGYVYYSDCGGCGEQIVVTPDGMVGVCQGYCSNKKYFVRPNASFDPLTHPFWEEWRFRSPLFMERCRNCIALSICGGGCPYSADQQHGSIWELDNSFCAHSKATVEFLVRDLMEKLSEKSSF